MPDTLFCTFLAGADLPRSDARIAALYRHWLSLRPAADALPGRAHLNPMRIPRLLPWLWLADVRRDPLRFKYRLVGTAHAEALTFDPTGRWLDEAHPRFLRSSAYPLFQAAAERSEISFYRGPPIYVIDADYKMIEQLILPMARDGETVDMLLGITMLDPQPPSE